MAKEHGRAEEAGLSLANSISEMVHMMYNKKTATRFLLSINATLIEGLDEFLK